ncbi:MAG TPA: tetratricopeptide repeat protein [bacterium]
MKPHATRSCRRLAVAAALAIAAPASLCRAADDPDELVRRSREHLEAGRLQDATEDLEHAAEARPEDAGLRLALARVLFLRNDLRGARRAVDEALELDPGSGPAHELSGDLYDREGLLNKAVGEWETAAAAGGSHALAAKIDRARREMAAEEGMGRESGRHFIVLYERDVPQALVRGFFGFLDRAFDVLHDRLGEYPRGDITVILYSRDAFRDITRMPDWAGGAYDGKIRIPVGGLSDVEEAAGLPGILVHEMTHAFLHQMAPQGLPLWFNEGIATAFQGWDVAAARAWFAAHGDQAELLTTLDDVDRTLRGRGGSVTAGYAAARLAVADLEELRGFGAVRRIVAAVGEGRPFAEAFRDETRLEVGEFEERWAKGLR